MKPCLIDYIDNSSAMQPCAIREEIHESQSCHCRKRCAKQLIQYDDPISPFSHYFLVRLTISTVHSVSFVRIPLPGKVLQVSNNISHWGHHGTLRNVFWGIDSQTVDTTVTVQVCQCYLVQQISVEFLPSANDLTERIHTQCSLLWRDIMMLASQ